MKAKIVLAAGFCAVCVGALVLLENQFRAREARHRAEVTALKAQLGDLQHRLKATEARLAELQESTRLAARPAESPPVSPPMPTVQRHVLTPAVPGTRPPNALEEFDMNGQKFYLTPLEARNKR